MIDLIEHIEDKVSKYPETIAIISGKEKVTYKEFYDIVKIISRNLTNLGSKPKIAFDLKQNIFSYALIVATIKSDGSFCPINPDSPNNRKKYILDEFDPIIFVVENKNDELITSINTILINSLVVDKVEYDFTNHRDVENIYAYTIYTSGSTGMPKGVQITRKALNKFLEWSIPAYEAKSTDIWAQYCFLTFDLSIVDIFTCLCSGATLFAIGDKVSKITPSKVIQENKITIWHSIPSAIELMITREKSISFDFSTLKLMSFCGEPLKKHHVEFLFKKNKKIKIFNTYGPTEGTLFCTWQEINFNNYKKFMNHTVSIGKAIPGWSIELLNNDNLSSDKEILIIGDYIGEYKKKVVGSGFSSIMINQKRVKTFRTGDFVKELDGNLFFLYRNDRQVKLNGNRIDIEEIDYWIREYYERPCVTIFNDNALYTFIEIESDINKQDLSEFLKEHLEYYKIPTIIRSIDQIPRNLNGKIDFNSLKKYYE